MNQGSLSTVRIGIKGAGEMASAIAWRLQMANFKCIFMMEIPHPLAVRRGVSFCEAVHDGYKTVEGITALRADIIADSLRVWEAGHISVLVDPSWESLKILRPDVSIDAITAKQNLGTSITEARLVIGLGPGFVAGRDVHLVIETNRGHNLGRILISGSAEPDTGVPGTLGGYSRERVLRAPASGLFQGVRVIGDTVVSGEVVGTVAEDEVRAEIGGVVRGLIRSGTGVSPGLKLGDIDPRGIRCYCDTISDKAAAIAGSVLEAVLRSYNR
jgi:xanthine dehydrogenase accessory factor